MQSMNHAVHNPARVGADSKSGLIHSASVTAGNVHDSHELPNLLHGGETRL